MNNSTAWVSAVSENIFASVVASVVSLINNTVPQLGHAPYTCMADESSTEF